MTILIPGKGYSIQKCVEIFIIVSNIIIITLTTCQEYIFIHVWLLQAIKCYFWKGLQ